MEIISETKQKASRTLKRPCSECRQPIMKGEVYIRLVQKWEGEIFSDNSHNECTEFAHKIHNVKREDFSPLEHSESYQGVRHWLHDAMMECPDNKRQILKLSKKSQKVRARLLKTLWEQRLIWRS